MGHDLAAPERQRARYIVSHGFFKKGEIADICVQHLGAGAEMTTRELAERVMVERDLEVTDAALRNSVVFKVSHPPPPGRPAHLGRAVLIPAPWWRGHRHDLDGLPPGAGCSDSGRLGRLGATWATWAPPGPPGRHLGRPAGGMVGWWAIEIRLGGGLVGHRDPPGGGLVAGRWAWPMAPGWRVAEGVTGGRGAEVAGTRAGHII